MTRRVIAGLFFIALLLATAAVWRLLHRAVPGPLQLSHVHFSDLPDWNAGDPRAALRAFQRSCTVMMAAPPETPPRDTIRIKGRSPFQGVIP